MKRPGIGRPVLIGIAVAVIIAVALGVLALTGPAPSVKPAQRTFYVVVYHWGFTFYDENFNEVPKIVVNKGDQVTLIVVPAEALTEEAHEHFEERTMKSGIGDLPPNDHRIHEEMEKAEQAGLMNHGVMIAAYNINVMTDVSKVTTKANSIREAVQLGNPGGARVSFTADKAGVFDIICSVFCGYGHPWMISKGALEVRG